MNNPAALIVFLKFPEKGHVKTRLAKQLGETMTFELYKNFIKDIFATVTELDYDIFINYTFYESPDKQSFFWDKRFNYFTQQGENLGQKMFNALQHVFINGYNRAVLIGSDIPTLDAKILNQSFTKLLNNDLVLGPTPDGGYYLIGCSKSSLHKYFFKDVVWSTSTVLEKTLSNVTHLDRKAILLPSCNDIDDLADLKKYYDQNKESKLHNNTLTYLQTIEEVLYEKI